MPKGLLGKRKGSIIVIFYGYFMNIYADGSGFFFCNYNAKRLFHDSVIRTSDGGRACYQGNYLTGVTNILLARIETAGAFLLCFLPTIPFIVTSIVTSCIFGMPAIALNLVSRIPGMASFESIRNFTTDSEDVIFRIMRLNLIMLPVIFLFLFGTVINVVPGILGEENIFSNLVNWLVEPLGPLKTICAVVDESRFEGTIEQMSALTMAEEFLRALSNKNYIQEISCDFVCVMQR